MMKVLSFSLCICFTVAILKTGTVSCSGGGNNKIGYFLPKKFLQHIDTVITGQCGLSNYTYEMDCYLANCYVITKAGINSAQGNICIDSSTFPDLQCFAQPNGIFNNNVTFIFPVCCTDCRWTSCITNGKVTNTADSFEEEPECNQTQTQSNDVCGMGYYLKKTLNCNYMEEGLHGCRHLCCKGESTDTPSSTVAQRKMYTFWHYHNGGPLCSEQNGCKCNQYKLHPNCPMFDARLVGRCVMEPTYVSRQLGQTYSTEKDFYTARSKRYNYNVVQQTTDATDYESEIYSVAP